MYGLSALSEMTRKSNHLQMSLQRQHFLLSYLTTLSVGPAGVMNPRSPAQKPDTQPTEPTVGRSYVQRRFISNVLRGCPCKNRPLDFRPKTEFLQIFRVRRLVHVINKNGNNLAFNAIFQYFWRQFQRTVQNRLNRSVSSQI